MYYWARSQLINSPSSSPGRIGQPTWLTDKSLGMIIFMLYTSYCIVSIKILI